MTLPVPNLNLFLYYDNKQQIRATIRIQECTESWPAFKFHLVVPVDSEMVDSEGRWAGIPRLKLKKT